MSLGRDIAGVAILWANPLFRLKNKRTRAIMILIATGLIIIGFAAFFSGFIYFMSSSGHIHPVYACRVIMISGIISLSIGIALTFIPGILWIVYDAGKGLLHDIKHG